MTVYNIITTAKDARDVACYVFQKFNCYVIVRVAKDIEMG
jgi:hypothetical protein